MKTTIETRPIFLRTPKHITGFMNCCTFGQPADRIRKAMNDLIVEKSPDEYYRFAFFR